MVTFSKREMLGMSALTASGLAGTGRAQGQSGGEGAVPLPQTPPGRFDSSVESLKTYRTPDWFSDAKFGIWSHWGPQAVPRQGDWYARCRCSSSSVSSVLSSSASAGFKSPACAGRRFRQQLPCGGHCR